MPLTPAQKAARKFKPKKSDALSFVFVGVKGGRLSKGGDRKGFVVYVTRDLKKVLLRPSYLRRGKSDKATRFSAYEVESLKGKKIARRKEVDRKSRATNYFKPIRGRMRSRTVLSFDKIGVRIVDVLLKELQRAGNRRNRSTNFRVLFHIRDRKTGKLLHDIDPVFPVFNLALMQTLNKSEVESYVFRTMYAIIARELKDRGLVSEGSEDHVRKLPWNKGKSHGRWQVRDKKGKLVAWEKRNPLEFRVVKIIGMEYEIRRQR